MMRLKTQNFFFFGLFSSSCSFVFSLVSGSAVMGANAAPHCQKAMEKKNRKAETVQGFLD